MRGCIPGMRAGSLSSLMKTWAALLILPLLLLVTACEKHPVSDLQKVDPSFEAPPGK